VFQRPLPNSALLLAFLPLLLAVAACSESPDTHLVVVMDTDYDVPVEVDRVQARVYKVSEDGTEEVQTWSREFMLTAEESEASTSVELPASFSVVPVASDIDRQVVVELDGMLEENLVVSRRARTGFVAGEFRVLRMFLYRQCSDTTCPEQTTCGCPGGDACASPSCVDEFVDPAQLDATDDPGILPPRSSIPVGCGSGLTLCGTECVDPSTDPRFCGDCETTCGSGVVCAGGQCIEPDDCRSDESRCIGFTYCDASTGNCERGCSNDDQCGSAERCDVETHTCVCDADLVRCPADFGDCVDIRMDLAHCGACNNTCPSNDVCSEGVCIDLGDCRTNDIGCTGFSYCDESTGNCVRGCLVDEQCGASNEVCDPETKECVCGDGFERCPPRVGACVDTQTDPTYCGGCDTSCLGGESCEGGLCIDPADCRENGIGCTGFTYCDQDTGVCLSGCDRETQCIDANDRCDLSSNSCVCNEGFTRCGVACVDLDTDERFCGSCATACGVGETCNQGQCIDANDCRENGLGCDGFTYCDPASGACLPGCAFDSQCASNQTCNVATHECVCQPGLTDCGVACVDLDTDERFCGSCATACEVGETCEQGQCIDPNDCRENGLGCDGFTYCDPASGACLPGCAFDSQCPSGQTCNVATRECVCESGLTNCDGVCVNTQFDEDNCGQCDERCRGNQICLFGTCIGSNDDDD
jgi:hypothetical protein